MIGLDANVLLRYLTQDDPVQSPRATAIIEQEISADAPGYVNLVALMETAWVLRSSYNYSQLEVAQEVERLLMIDSIVIDHADEVYAAVSLVQDRYGNFADALIARLNKSVGCGRTITFDTRALRIPGFERA